MQDPRSKLDKTRISFSGGECHHCVTGALSNTIKSKTNTNEIKILLYNLEAAHNNLSQRKTIVQHKLLCVSVVALHCGMRVDLYIWRSKPIVMCAYLC